MIVLFLFSGFSISQVGETELTRTTQEQKEKQEKFTPEQKANWEKAKKEAVEKREAILKQKAEEIDEFYKEKLPRIYHTSTFKKEMSKLITMIEKFDKQKKKLDKELEIFGERLSPIIPSHSYTKKILVGAKAEIDSFFKTHEETFLKWATKELISRTKKFRALKSKLCKEFEIDDVSKITIPVICYTKTILENEKISIKEFFQKMAANGRIVKSEVKKLDKKIKQFDKLKKKLRKGLKIKKKQITVEIPEDWREIHAISFGGTWVHFKDDKEENIRKIIIKWTGQDTKVVKVNRYSDFRIVLAFVISFVVFVFFIWIFPALSWINIAIGLIAGICYFIFY